MLLSLHNSPFTSKTNIEDFLYAILTQGHGTKVDTKNDALKRGFPNRLNFGSITNFMFTCLLPECQQEWMI